MLRRFLIALVIFLLLAGGYVYVSLRDAYLERVEWIYLHGRDQLVEMLPTEASPACDPREFMVRYDALGRIFFETNFAHMTYCYYYLGEARAPEHCKPLLLTVRAYESLTPLASDSAITPGECLAWLLWTEKR